MPPKGRGRGIKKTSSQSQLIQVGANKNSRRESPKTSTIEEVNFQHEDSPEVVFIKEVKHKVDKLQEKDEVLESSGSSTELCVVEDEVLESSGSSTELCVVDNKVKGHSSDSSSSDNVIVKKTPKLEEQYIPNSPKFIKAKKNGYGKCFRKEINIVTNFYQLNTKKQNVFHYDVEILCSYDKGNAKPLSKELSRLVIFELGKRNKHLDAYTPIFDGKKNLFTSKSLPFDKEEEFEVPCCINGRVKLFYVVIKPVQKKKSHNNIISHQLLEAYMNKELENLPEQIRLVYEAILSHRKLDSYQIRSGMSFFSVKNSIASLGDGLEILQGYNQNIRFTEKGPTIVINVATAAFHKSGSIITYISDILRKKILFDSFLKDYEIERLNKIIRGIRIQVTHDKYKRKYYIQQIIRALPQHHQFTMDNGGKKESISVEEYFRTVYKYPLKFRRLPLLEMKSSKNVCLPMEVCNVIPGQKIASNFLDGRKKAEMIKRTAIAPALKFNHIQSYADEVSRVSSSAMTNYGLSMNLEPITFKTRVLKQPEIKYGSSFVRPNDQGVWNMQTNYLSPVGKIDKWMIMNFAERCEKEVVDNLAYLLCKVGNRVGIRLSPPVIINCFSWSTVDALERAAEQKMELIVVVISKDDIKHSYAEIKWLCDLKYHLKCQCINVSLISDSRKFNEKAVENICLKINAKLEGVNHTLRKWPIALDREAVLIIGADVVHSGDLDCSSIAAVVGCVDYEVFKYVVSCRALSNPNQNGKNQEIILTLKDMMKTILRGYYRNAKKKPQKILFYRDGISEGQFQKALETEIPMIQAACKELENDYKPPITYVVVQKRIQARFKPKYESDGVGRMKNVPSGTVIDQHIVDPVNFDFYLVSHEGIQGTSKPVYYTVLFDENGVEPDVIQELTFDLCHVFARCNRSISIPAPVKYADILAYRAMNYIKALKSQHSKGRFSQTSDKVPKEIVDLLEKIESIQSKMFFI